MTAEQFAFDGDRMKSAIGLLPGGGGGREVRHNASHAEQTFDQWPNGALAFHNVNGSQRDAVELWRFSRKHTDGLSIRLIGGHVRCFALAVPIFAAGLGISVP